jgi:Trk-type K+ transport system membrane component
MRRAKIIKFVDEPEAGPYLFTVFISFFFIIGSLVVFMIFKAWRYATCIGQFVRSSSNSDLENALNHQRVCWKLGGLMVILTIFGFFLLISVYAFSSNGPGRMRP